MQVLLRRLGEHRGAPRLYLDCASLANAGFRPGQALAVSINTAAFRVSISVDAHGTRRVSRKRRGNLDVPVIDINCAATFAVFSGQEVVRLVLADGQIHVLLSSGAKRAMVRAARLASRLALGQPLRVAGVAFGAGIASRALHDGLKAGGVHAELALANELCEDYLDVARERNPVVKATTALAAVPMQELAADEWLLGRVGHVEVLEAGIPCSGASRAGAAKRKLTRMEDHPTVGHLMGAFIQLVGALQPSVVVLENVVSYRDSASAAILRRWLQDAGYAVHEVELDARAFGSLEARVRWFLVAVPQGVQLDLAVLTPPVTKPACLQEVLEDVSDDDPRWREVAYLKAKEGRDAAKGCHFAMQWLDPNSTAVPTLRKGYHKGGSTDPRLVHPSDPSLSRLLTGVEHARIKGVDPALVAGLPETLAHQVCGQAVDVRPVAAIGEQLASAMQAWAQSSARCGSGLSGRDSASRRAALMPATG